MSAETRPISANQFALALQDLPIENIYSKANEIQNSIDHLQQSNAQLQEYSDSIKNDASLDATTQAEGDRDCLEAIGENEIVIKRQEERIDLLKKEVERRGGRWHEADSGSKPVVNGSADHAPHNAESQQTSTAPAAPRPRLTDDELRRRLEEQMGDEDEGMHL